MEVWPVCINTIAVLHYRVQAWSEGALLVPQILLMSLQLEQYTVVQCPLEEIML